METSPSLVLLGVTVVLQVCSCAGGGEGKGGEGRGGEERGGEGEGGGGEGGGSVGDRSQIIVRSLPSERGQVGARPMHDPFTTPNQRHRLPLIG